MDKICVGDIVVFNVDMKHTYRTIEDKLANKPFTYESVDKSPMVVKQANSKIREYTDGPCYVVDMMYYVDKRDVRLADKFDVLRWKIRNGT